MSARNAGERAGAGLRTGDKKHLHEVAALCDTNERWSEAMARAYMIGMYEPGPARIRAVRRWRLAIIAALSEESNQAREMREGGRHGW